VEVSGAKATKQAAKAIVRVVFFIIRHSRQDVMILVSAQNL